MHPDPEPQNASSHESGAPNPGVQSDEELDDLLDEALDETFPASDPIAVHRHKPANRPADPAVSTPKEKPKC